MKLYKFRTDMVFDCEVEVPDSPTFPPFTTKTSPYPIPSGHYAVMDGVWRYVAGNPPPLPISNDFVYIDTQQENVKKANEILSETDWTSIPAVGDPLQSNPYLVNQTEWLHYRSKIRNIAVNNGSVGTDWPTPPQEIWSN